MSEIHGPLTAVEREHERIVNAEMERRITQHLAKRRVQKAAEYLKERRLAEFVELRARRTREHKRRSAVAAERASTMCLCEHRHDSHSRRGRHACKAGNPVCRCLEFRPKDGAS
jgi:RNA 3'-terminal phosphate cyclase